VNGQSPTHGIIDLIIASFLHWDFIHLFTNFVVAFFMMGFLECAFGSVLTLISFFAGIVFTNPGTSLILWPFFYIFAPDGMQKFFHEPDIGSSLGIFACIGTLSVFVKRPIWLISVFSLATLIYNIHVHSFMGYNHLVALLIGYLIGKRYALKN
jgi:hypothetical protein